jgi:nicotinamidase-related amidase
MINTWAMADGRAVRREAVRILPQLRRLLDGARRARAPFIYANDNFGQWRSDLPALIARVQSAGAASRRIVDALAPEPDDYIVLKPRHSAFFATPLELLLQSLRTGRLVITGASGDQCVLGTVADALLRGYDVVVPRDAIACATPARTRAIVSHFDTVMKVRTPLARSWRWH